MASKFTNKVKDPVIVCVAAVVVIALLVLLVKYHNDHPSRNKLVSISNRSADLATNNQYAAAAQNLAASFNKQPATNRASIALQIGKYYQYANSNAQAKEWMTKALNLYKQSGDADGASEAQAALDNLAYLSGIKAGSTEKGKTQSGL